MSVKVAMFTQEQEKEQRRMQKKLASNEITAEDYSKFLEEEIAKGELHWKNYVKNHTRNHR